MLAFKVLMFLIGMRSSFVRKGYRTGNSLGKKLETACVI